MKPVRFLIAVILGGLMGMYLGHLVLTHLVKVNIITQFERVF